MLTPLRVDLRHSYGGVPGSEAVGMLSEAQPRNPAASRIKRLVFLASHVIDKGESLVGSGGRSIPNIDTSKVLFWIIPVLRDANCRRME